RNVTGVQTCALPICPGEEIGCSASSGGIHAHVQRRVLGVGEAAVDLIQLHRGDTEVEQDALHAPLAAVPGGHLGDLVVDGMHGEIGRASCRERVEHA